MILSVLGTILLFPVTLVVYLLSPVLRIRFGRIDADRLGFLAFQPDVYFFNRRSEKKSGVDFFYYEGLMSNLQLKRMWDRVLLTSVAAKYIARGIACLPGARKFAIDMAISPNYDYATYFKETSPPVFFTRQETKFGIEELCRLGIPAEGFFFCFTNRAADQFKSLPLETIERNSYRDFSIDDLMLAVKALVNLGSCAVRLGTADSPLSWKEDNVLDYASSSRSDFLDLFLISRCRFFLGPNAGPYVVSTLFRRPVAFINVTPLMGANGYFSQMDIFIPKKYKSVREGRIMTLTEVIRSGAHLLLTSDCFRKLGIEVISNTPEEIRDLALEMNARLSGTWKILAEEEQLQAKFKSIVRQSAGESGLKIPRIGASFLLSNPQFLN